MHGQQNVKFWLENFNYTRPQRVLLQKGSGGQACFPANVIYLTKKTSWKNLSPKSPVVCLKAGGFLFHRVYQHFRRNSCHLRHSSADCNQHLHCLECFALPSDVSAVLDICSMQQKQPKIYHHSQKVQDVLISS